LPQRRGDAARWFRDGFRALMDKLHDMRRPMVPVRRADPALTIARVNP
jgi:hypothetical protein